MDRERAFYVTVRAHRGGGFTKDYLYLTGLKKVYNYYKQGKDLKHLLTGKISLAYLDSIQSLYEKDRAGSAHHLTE